MDPENPQPYEAAPAPPPPSSPPPTDGTAPAAKGPSLVFLIIVAVLSLAGDIASKSWAEKRLDGFPGMVEVWKDHAAFVLAKNKGGAWGLLQGTTENVRRPFFLLVSVAAIAFIMTLYRRLLPSQRSLKWGLPLVLGGALGNVFDRVRYGHVIDFIDLHIILKGKDHHWPTFNVADIAICVGVGLMAIDMFTSKRPGRMSTPLVPGEPIPAALPPPVPAPPAGDKP
jgi:lipoprotein signal peptidase